MAPLLSGKLNRSSVAFIVAVSMVIFLATPVLSVCNCPNGGGTVQFEKTVNCRSGPSQDSKLVGTVPLGKFYKFVCQARGQSIQGNPIWDKLDRSFQRDCYVSDYYMKTGCPRCTNVLTCE